MLETAKLAVEVVLVVLGAAVAVLHLVAPRTKTDVDDKLETKLEKVRKFIAELVAKVVVPKQLKK